MSVRLGLSLSVVTIGFVLTFVPVSSFAGSAQDAFKKLQGQNGAEIKARSASSTDRAKDESRAAKDKDRKAMKDIVNKGSKKSRE